jgi:hypothetical protein
MALEELLRDGFITGVRRGGEKDRVNAIANVRIAVSGRLFLEELKRKEEAKTSWGLIKQKRWDAYKFFWGIVAGIVIALATNVPEGFNLASRSPKQG